MSLPGPISKNFKKFQNDILNKTSSKGTLNISDQGQLRTFWKNRLKYFENNLKYLAKSLSENSTIPIVKISELGSTVKLSNLCDQGSSQQNSQRELAQRVILYGMIKRYPLNFTNNLFLDRQMNPDIEDIVPGNWIPTIENFQRKLNTDFVSYVYDESDIIYLEDYSDVADVHYIKVSNEDLLDKNKNFITTGTPIVLIGRYSLKSSSFNVEEYEILSVGKDKIPETSSPEKQILPKIEKRVLCIANLSFGQCYDTPNKYLTNLIYNLASNTYGKVSNIIVLGGILNAWDFNDSTKMCKKVETNILKLNSLVYNKKTFSGTGVMRREDISSSLNIIKALDQADEFLVNLLELAPVTIFPDKYDLTFKHPPFTGLHRDMFCKSKFYKNFRVCDSSISDLVIKDEEKELKILGVSHTLNLKNKREALALQLQGIKCSNLLPGAPFPERVDSWYTNSNDNETKTENTIPDKIYDQIPDPFLLKNEKATCPDVILIRSDLNLSGFVEVDAVGKKKVFVQNVPDFLETKKFCILDFAARKVENVGPEVEYFEF